MTSQRELDSLLGAFFADGPDQVADRVIDAALDQIDQTRQRRPMRVPGRFQSMNMLSRLAAAAVIGVLLVGTFVYLTRPAVPPIGASPTPVATVSPSQPAAVVPSPSLVAPSLAPLGAPQLAQAGQFDQVCDFSLASASVGWVSTNSALYRTVDAGTTWSAVQPQGWSGASAQPRAIFVDANTAYVYMAGSQPSIAVTHDGGASWHATVLDAAAVSDVPKFAFQTPSSGSVIFVGEVGGPIKTGPGNIYTTTDGGATWTGPQAATDLSGPPSCGTQSAQAVMYVQGKFQPPDPTNLLRLSRDGGLTSYDRSFPFGPAAPEANTKTALDFWADDSGRIVMAMSVANADGSCCLADQVYTSSDDGRSWQLIKDLGSPPHGQLIAQLLSATEWVFFSDVSDEFLSTVDGGGHWRTVVGSSTLSLRQASFASADVGWASIFCGGSATSHIPDYPACPPTGTGPLLLATADGGRTWAPIGQ